MPWFRDTEEARLWFVYVDAEVTLRGFDTFLEQYRGVLGAVRSGVIYASPAPWPGPVQRVFDKVIESADGQRHGLAAFLDYCGLRERIEANEWASISVANVQQYRVLERVFNTVGGNALYQRWRQAPNVSVTSAEVATARRPDCVLRMYPLGHRYCDTRRAHTAKPG